MNVVQDENRSEVLSVVMEVGKIPINNLLSGYVITDFVVKIAAFQDQQHPTCEAIDVIVLSASDVVDYVI